MIKWKDVFEHLEEANDTCEDVADILEGIVLKHKKSRLVLDRKESKKNNGWYKVKWRDGADGQTLTDF